MQTLFSLKDKANNPPTSTPKAFFSKHRNGGAERDRTADPLLAKQVLSQLSYSPNPFSPKAANLDQRTQPQTTKQEQSSTSRRDGPSGAQRQSRDSVRTKQWWARVDSNYRPHAYQACALTD
jgi:hypothetical protein